VSHGCNRTADGAQLWIALLLASGPCCQWEIGDDGGARAGVCGERRAGGRLDGSTEGSELSGLPRCPSPRISLGFVWVASFLVWTLDSACSVRARREQFGVHLSVCHGNFTTSAMLTAFCFV
jgi:hypothetical protein